MNIVITGASRGIGKAVAQRFAGDATTIILNARNQSVLQSFAAELQQRTSAKVLSYAADLAKKKAGG